MNTPMLQIEDCREFKPWLCPHRAAARPTPQNPARLVHRWLVNPAAQSPLRRSEGDTIAFFSAADLIRQGDGRRALHGGPPADYAAARGWNSGIQLEASLPGNPSALTAPRPEAENAIQNRILIADDDTLVRGSLAAVLEFEGFVVEEAQNGIEAVTRAIAHTPDLVLLDLNMPHWDGWTAFSQLDRVTPLLPVIVITARPNQYQKAVQLGVDAFMEKPLNLPVLVRAIKHLTSENENHRVRRITNRAHVTQLLGGTKA
jgi:CheY-like chemotaxis protein